MSRLVKLSRSAYEGRTPPEACGDNPIRTAAEAAVADYRRAMDDFAFHRALEALWRILAEVNQYLVAREPWKRIKEGDTGEAVSRILWNGLEGVRIVATGLLPVMPKLAPDILAAIGTPEVPTSLDALAWGGTPLSAELAASPRLFPRVDKAAYLAGEVAAGAGGAKKPTEDEDGMGLITIDKFFETELKVGRVTGAEAIPKAKKLLKLTVDLGEEAPRTLVAGIAEAYEPEALVGRQIVVVANLQPAKLMGVESQGMILAASVGGRPVLLEPDAEVPPGTPIK